jgi:hypothetical protein
MKGRLKTPKAAQNFILAGNATITLRSKKTGVRFTYKINRSQKEGDDRHFVKVLSGPDNNADYVFMGTIFESDRYRHDKQERNIRRDAPSAKAFAFFYDQLSGLSFNEALEVWHEGRCCRCGRKLTVPSSVESGLGPECAGKVGFAAEEAF